MFLILEHNKPVSIIVTADSPPSGNWNKMLSSDEYPKVEAIRGPNPDTAPLTVYLIRLVVSVNSRTLQKLTLQPW